MRTNLGSADIPAAMRSILHVMKHPEDPNECVAVHIKSSNSAKGPTMAQAQSYRAHMSNRDARAG